MSGFIKPRPLFSCSSLSFSSFLFFVAFEEEGREEILRSISSNLERTRSMDAKYFDSAMSNTSSSSIVVAGVAVEVGEGEEKSLCFLERSERAFTSSSILGGKVFG